MKFKKSHLTYIAKEFTTRWTSFVFGVGSFLFGLELNSIHTGSGFKYMLMKKRGGVTSVFYSNSVWEAFIYKIKYHIFK